MTSTKSEQLEKPSGLARRLLALLVGLLTTIALITFGAPGAAAQNAVGPHPQNLILTIGVQTVAAPEGVGLHTLQLRPIVSATGVAAETAADAGGFSNSALESSANAIDRNGLTRAGRALQKHGDRPGSVFPRSVGSAEARNAQGLGQVNAILNDPNRTVDVLDKVINIYGSNGAGVRYSVGGDFMGFLEP
ncbi:hypothetical protein M6D93_01545 [Jatrophihabitans telluris]|uniref:Uncharacterized protein n=1 Tax=Jatrophihabitans telluris TaxID=2038343 RepID=A0ABY4QYR2_9ACTN|nr:hypothetical protein [Jatrophihabitans telluris]UQX88699.1 hypothetical protein M6D93_01545 [Jatrophihabitans telluris]